MLLRTRKLLISLLAVCFAAAVIAFGVSLLAPEKTAQAVTGTELTSETGKDLDGDYYLAGDVTRTTAINIASGKTVTIDLNGYQLKLSGFAVKISVYGTLTLKDTYTGARTHDITDPETGETVKVVGGVMTGGQSGCISVYNGGTLNMESGVIAGADVTSSSGAGGVSVYDGTFNMSGGTISHNRAGVGGVTVDGAFNMSGGSIVYNTGTSDNNGAGGVFVADGKTFRVEGAVNITNNKLIYNSNKSDNNVCVYTGNKIYVNGNLENEKGDKAEIGVTISGEIYYDTFVGGVITSGYSSSGNTEKPSAFFTSDYGKCVSIEEGEAKTGAHDIGVADGVCAICQTRMAASVTQAAAPDFYDTIEKAWAAANTAGTATVKMFTDAEAAQTLETEGSKNITFDLNGCMLAIKEGAEGPVISVKGGAAFTLTDTNTDKSKKHTVDNPTTAVTTDTVEIVGGVVTGGKGDYGGVYVLSGTFNFNGGTIAGNTARIGGGGVYMQDSGNERGNRGIINMSGSAAIKYNAAQQGGGVLIWGSLGAFNFSGGSIDHNSAYGTGTVDGGGGVYVTNGTFEMTDGAISYNTANCGGGVFIRYENFKMSGGTINGNVSSTTGGGVDVRDAFEMTGGAISDNTANNGGGVYCNGSFKAEKLSEITNNTANVYGGGVFNYGTFEIKDAVSVSGNKNGAGESAKADNVYLSPDKKITVTGKLVYGAYNAAIGVNVPSQYSGAFTAGYGASNKFGNGTTVDPNNYFTSDDESKLVVSDGEEVLLANPVASVTGGGTYAYISEAWAAANDAGTATVTLLADAEISETLTVASGKNITLDLNGHKLALKADKSGSVIEVNGTFALSDDKTNIDYNTTPHTIASPVTSENIQIDGGLVTGGNASGIRVNASAKFTMNGGTVAGNTATDFGGGVYITGGGAFVMSNGAIMHNKAENGGGVYMGEKADFTMSGGEITHNNVRTHGGGVYVFRGIFHLSGKVGITDNANTTSASNVYLVDASIGSSKIRVDGEITDGSQIGVFSGGPCITDYKQSDKPSKFFTLDYYDCIYVSDKTNGTVTIASHKGGTATCTQKAVCTECGESYGEVNAAKHTPNADDGDCTTALTCKGCSAVITAAYGSHLWSIGYQYDDTHHWLKCDRAGCTQTATKFAHSYGVWQTETEATCLTKGSERHNCLSCGHYETREIDKDEKAHSLGAWQNRVAATCTTAGTKAHKDCTLCGKHFDASNAEIADLTIDALGHDFGDPEWTWSDDGRTASALFTCARDGTHTHAVGVDGVTVTSEVKIAATCTEKGTTAYTAKVTVDDVEYTDTKEIADIDIIAHSYGEWQTATAATCSSKGSKTRGCSVCGHEETEETDIDENAHSWNSGEVTTAASCTSNGVKTFTCSHNSAHTKEETVNKLGHAYATEFTVDTEATCTSKGSKSKHCSRCTEKTEVTEIEMIAHTYGEWQMVTAATCTTEGSKKRVCSICSTEETAGIAIDANAHTFATAWSNDASGHWHAATCDHISQKDGFAAHTAGEWIIDTPAQIDVAGSQHRDCAVCGYRVQTEIEPLVEELIKPGSNGGENQVVVTTPNGFTQDIELVVTEIAKENFGAYESVAQTVNGEINLVYDVTLKSNGVSIQPDGTLTIRLLIPANLRSKDFKIFHLHGGTATDTEYTVDGNYAVVTTDKLSEFIFVGEKTVAPAPAPAAFNPLWLILIIIVSLVIVGEAGYIVYRKVRKNKAAEGRE